ncbi:hypothetical protein NicSoilB8_38350 [Arthrobacter sp. NicSoilB8]|nr:hypothetical protein NicSoilB8_38350 [Arthrobacter sp. NicSoilB8]
MHGDVFRIFRPDEVARARMARGQRAGAPGGQMDVGAPARHGHVFADMRHVRAAAILRCFLAAGRLGASGCTVLLAVHGGNSLGSVEQMEVKGA